MYVDAIILILVVIIIFNIHRGLFKYIVVSNDALSDMCFCSRIVVFTRVSVSVLHDKVNVLGRKIKTSSYRQRSVLYFQVYQDVSDFFLDKRLANLSRIRRYSSRNLEPKCRFDFLTLIFWTVNFILNRENIETRQILVPNVHFLKILM